MHTEGYFVVWKCDATLKLLQHLSGSSSYCHQGNPEAKSYPCSNSNMRLPKIGPGSHREIHIFRRKHGELCDDDSRFLIINDRQEDSLMVPLAFS